MKFKFLLLFLLASLIRTAASQDLGIKSPNVSANAIFLGKESNFHKANPNLTAPDQEPNGLDIQEAEVQFYSDVDPYLKLNLILSIHPQYTSDGTQVTKEWGIEPEEIFFESHHIQALTLKGGKFLASFGKHNELHTHAFPFVNQPLGNKHLLGEDGLNDSGLSAAWLLPFQNYQELTLQFLRGDEEGSGFHSPRPSDGVWLGRYNLLLDLDEASTIEWGMSFATGNNSHKEKTEILGADLTWKWRPLSGGKYHSAIVGFEWIKRRQDAFNQPPEDSDALTGWARWQWSQRWAILYRFDNLEVGHTLDTTNFESGYESRSSLGVEFSPSEFSKWKLEYDHKEGRENIEGQSVEKAIYMQIQMTIGSHPAHKY